MNASASSVHRKGENRVLALLPKSERERILARCERVVAEAKVNIFRANAAIGHVYFPLSGMASMVLTSHSGATVEVGTVGNDGMVGLPVYFGAKSSPTEGIWQVSGEALRMKAKDFMQELEKGGVLRSVLQRFSQALMNQISQSILCTNLQKAALIRYTRGTLTVVDRNRLEASSCECYAVVKKESERLLQV